MYKDIFPKNYFINNDTFDLYHSGLFYKNFVLSSEYYPYQYEDWYNNKGYGRYDSNGNVIYPKNSFLKQYKNESNIDQKNLLFVADAFSDLKNFFTKLEIKDKVDLGSIYVNLNAKNSTDDVENMYIQYINDIFPFFQQYYRVQTNRYQPSDFNFFMNRIILFLRIILRAGVINRSTYMKSFLAPTSIDGLRIDLSDKVPYTDYKKIANKFIGDRGFEFFVKTSARFGFFVDKYKPWSIVADLNSPVMLEYAMNYNLKSKEEIFNTCYHKAYSADLDNLINLLIVMWNIVASKDGIQVVSKESSICSKTDVHSYKLQQLTRTTFNHYYSIVWQIRFYMYTKILEEKVYFPQEKFESFYIETCNVYKIHGIEEALRYVNVKIHEYMDRISQKQRRLTTASEFDKLLLGQVDLNTKEELHF